ncbi:exopolysaccharide biosynthesis polyprenyl glycosylphosphotransferase [Kitasatospora sp. GP82]|uniref:exopolysaccharide biosynthesis polyprenyl glycosylphosphotransferase n=1 Tax=Kitasatospora sp. GP82 TaxID=3035089 RepID=UPI0024745C1D|nr:exopolysaccharide biosynthesis polyprenyl glycosylphosphotransferase [Kitasatospora sp. GP82]MDH6130605.1 exopolysaccharide biosynthesis polyprenyl glycosylphosphotransferase [Kitasatospora sp. GP82]
MTIDHESVPRPGRPLPNSRRIATGLLDRPKPASQTRASAALGRHRRPFRSRLALPIGLLAVDTLAVCTATTLTADRTGQPLLGTAAVLPLLLPLNLAAGLYRTRLTLSALDELPALATRATVALAFAVTLSACLEGLPHTAAHPPRLLATLTALVLLAAGGRAFVYHLLRRARRRRPSPALVLGAGELGQRVAAALTEHREYGLRPVGYLDPGPVLLAADAKLPVLGGREVLEREIRRNRIHHVVATDGAADEAETAASLREAARLGCQVWLVPALREYGSVAGPDRDQLWGFPCLKLGRPAMRRQGWPVKRALDILASGLGLLALAPVLAACALAVRFDTGPGVLFRQQRTGLDGRVFTVLKFRTLRPSSEHESATRWNISQDHRMGTVGRLLRRSSLDELPQLWNVLRGDMSLVGPRPERPYFVMRFGQAYPEYADRHRVPVGLTGLAQVNGLRGDTSIEDRARFDNRYVESWSLWQDAKILLRTAVLMLHPDGS